VGGGGRLSSSVVEHLPNKCKQEKKKEDGFINLMQYTGCIIKCKKQSTKDFP
jgi:hypothetical protein